MEPRLVRLSRRISRVLRHAPASVGITLDAQGWVPVDELLAALGVARADLNAVVTGNDKRRFAVHTGPDGVERIRASQGHSRTVAVDLGLAPSPPPESLYHGTPTRNVPAILADGLRAGRRHHVHLSADVPTALAVGRRRTADVAVLRVRATDLAATGHPFYRSANGVWLTSHVPPAYLDTHSAAQQSH